MLETPVRRLINPTSLSGNLKGFEIPSTRQNSLKPLVASVFTPVSFFRNLKDFRKTLNPITEGFTPY
jgi:hypothetical protein